MRKTSIAAAFAGALAASVAIPGVASAQVADGSELRGAVVRVVSADGTSNTLNFYPDGTVTIQSPSGTDSVQGRWFVQNQQLCIESNAGVRECWQYLSQFQPGQEVVLTSDCPATARWTAMQTAPVQQQPTPGERG